MDSATVATKAKSGPAFEGTPDQQALAAKAFELMGRQGLLYAADTPIVVPLDRLVQGLQRSYPQVAPAALRTQVEKALQANGAVFARQETDGKVAYETTKSGQHRVEADEGRHMFRRRLNPDARTVTQQESRTEIDDLLAQAAAREQFTIFQEPAAEAAIAGRWQGPAEIAAFVAPTQPVRPELSPFESLPPAAIQPPQIEASPLPVEPFQVDVGLPAIAMPTAPVEIPDEPAAVALPEAATAPIVVPATPAAAEPVLMPTAPLAGPAPLPTIPAVPATPVPVAPSRPVAPPAPPRPVRYALPEELGGGMVDLSGSLDDILAAHGAPLEGMLDRALRDDFRFASFGGDWYPEENVERFSKGDFRRIREYLIETQDALSDRTFLNDVLGRRENDQDYERLRFSLNYRMLREKKDFEFVGVPSDRLWVVAGASPVSVPKRKPSELGQDYRYLEDTAIRALEPSVPNTATRLEHAVTYYEYENGLLPYDAAARALLPPPMMEDQRAALLRIEVPLLFQNFPVELRYPTGNRGGYLVGFDAFFQENLVPGATLTLENTDQENVLVLRFERTTAQEESLLQYDERRNRFVVRPTTFYAGVSPDWILSEKRFPRLDGVKRLDESERKKSDHVVIRAFELVGEEVDGRLYALISDLLPVVNLERPFSVGALRAVLESGTHPAFEADPDTPGAFYYDPTARQG